MGIRRERVRRIGPGQDTLEGIRDRINAADAGVDAAIVFDGSAHRLTLTSKSSGAAFGFRTTVADNDGNNTNAAGLSRLAYNPPGGATHLVTYDPHLHVLQPHYALAICEPLRFLADLRSA